MLYTLCFFPPFFFWQKFSPSVAPQPTPTSLPAAQAGRGSGSLGNKKPRSQRVSPIKFKKKRQFYTALLLEPKEVALNHIPPPPRSPSTLTCGLPAPPPRCRLRGADTRGSTVQVFLRLAPRAAGTEGNIPKAGGCNPVLLTTAKRPAARNNTGSQRTPENTSSLDRAASRDK